MTSSNVRVSWPVLTSRLKLSSDGLSRSGVTSVALIALPSVTAMISSLNESSTVSACNVM